MFSYFVKIQKSSEFQSVLKVYYLTKTGKNKQNIQIQENRKVLIIN